MSTYLVAGRSLANWRENGQTPPADAVLVRCAFCSEEVTLSPEGVERLASLPRAGERAVPCCSQCATLVAAVHANNTEIRVTDYMRNQALQNPAARAYLDGLLKLTGQKQPGEGEGSL